MNLQHIKYILGILVISLLSCNGKQPKIFQHIVFKGVYSFGPEVKTFKDCYSGQEFWVTDHSGQLELKYSQLNFEKPYEPVYVEIEGVKVHSGKVGLGSEYDSTMVVNKLIKISKEIPLDSCK